MRKRKSDIVFAVIAVIVVCLLMAFTSGCKESQQSVKVWGKGELPADHQEFFGNDNTARLDYVQNRMLDKHTAIIKEIARRVLILEAVDPNAMVPRIEALEMSTAANADSALIANDGVVTTKETVEAVDPNAMRLEALELGMEKLTLVEAE